MEDKRNNEVQRPHTHRNPKTRISLVSLLMCCKIVTVLDNACLASMLVSVIRQ